MAKWYDMFELFTEPIFVSDETNTIIYSNPTAAKLYKQSLKKRRAEDFVPELFLKK